MRTYNKINESKYINKVIAHVENDPLDSRLELKKIYSLSTDEYFELLDYEVNLINSLQGEIFDTSDPKWVGTGNYEFTFEVDRAYIIEKTLQDDYSLFKGDIIDVNVNIDRGGTVYLFDPERESSIGEAVSDDNIGYIVESEINDIIYRILEQRLPELKNFNTFNIIDTILYMVDLDNKNNISESTYSRGDDSNLLDNIAIYMYRESIDYPDKFPFDSTYISFTDYIKNTYGITDQNEIEYLFSKFRYYKGWEDKRPRYLDFINEGVYTAGSNEDLVHNKEKWKKENQFFVKIVNQIMRETVTDYKNNVIKFPFDSELVIGPLFFSDINNILDSNINNLSGVFPYNFYDHCKDVYGLKYNEIKRLWTLYSAELIKHILKVWDKEWVDYQISDQGTMGTLLPESTKSVGDNSEFLNKIVDYMVDTTELVEIPHHPNIRIKYPFIDYGSTNKIPHMWYEAVPKVIFIVGMMENYGLNGEEAHFVLDKYKEKLRNKVKTKLPNE